MNNLNKESIVSKEVYVDNGEQGYWYKGWYEVKYGLVNDDGEWVIPAMFNDIAYSEGMFIAKYKTDHCSKIYFINDKGQIPFKSNLNIIEAKDYYYGYSLIQVADISEYSHSVPWTYVIDQCKWGLIDKNGNVIEQPVYDYEHEVKISNITKLAVIIAHKGCEVLHYADENLFTNEKNNKVIEVSMKKYLINYYNSCKDKESLKKEKLKQEKLLKEIKKSKLDEHYSATIDKNNIDDLNFEL